MNARLLLVPSLVAMAWNAGALFPPRADAGAAGSGAVHATGSIQCGSQCVHIWTATCEDIATRCLCADRLRAARGACSTEDGASAVVVMVVGIYPPAVVAVADIATGPGQAEAVCVCRTARGRLAACRRPR
jgi:hypothetical protein